MKTIMIIILNTGTEATKNKMRLDNLVVKVEDKEFCQPMEKILKEILKLLRNNKIKIT
jgi:hypothetical protein